MWKFESCETLWKLQAHPKNCFWTWWKYNKKSQTMFDSETGSCCVSTNILPWWTDKMRLTWHETNISHHQHHPLVFFLYKMDWLRNGMSTKLIGDLAINSMHGSMILILKTSICSVYMDIQPHKEMACSFFIYTWFIR